MSTLTEATLLEMPRRRRWTREFYYRAIDAGLFDEDDKVELIGGELVEGGMVDRMAPQSPMHRSAIELLQCALSGAFGRGFRICVQLPLSLGADSDPEPDIAVVRGSPRDDPEHHPPTAVLVAEVAIASARFDRTVKAGLYASAGIREYWIVDLSGGALEVYREPALAPDRPFEAAYGSSKRLVKGDTVRPIAAPHAGRAVSDLLL